MLNRWLMMALFSSDLFSLMFGQSDNCPQSGFAINSVSVTPISGLFMHCRQKMTETVDKCEVAPWSRATEIVHHYCGNGTYASMYDQVADKSTGIPDFRYVKSARSVYSIFD